MFAEGEKLIVDNRRARHDYHLLGRFEAGLVLSGSEVKSLRQGQANLTRAFGELRSGEVWLIGAHIAPYEQSALGSHDPDRARKLLLRRREIDSLTGDLNEKGLTLVPTRLYFKAGRVKIELALGRGKTGRDKRDDLAKRDAKREIERELKTRR